MFAVIKFGVIVLERPADQGGLGLVGGDEMAMALRTVVDALAPGWSRPGAEVVRGRSISATRPLPRRGRGIPKEQSSQDLCVESRSRWRRSRTEGEAAAVTVIRPGFRAYPVSCPVDAGKADCSSE